MTVPLDLDQLQSFCAIADCGSFTEAARRVNKTQSAVSMQIKRLEERLGHTLLSRDGRSVTLTQHGEALYSRARKMLKMNADNAASIVQVIDAAQKNAAQLSNAAAGIGRNRSLRTAQIAPVRPTVECTRPSFLRIHVSNRQ